MTCIGPSTSLKAVPGRRARALRWDAREQELRSTVADRQYLEAREDVAASAAGAFFDLYAADAALENAATNAAVNDTLYILSKGRYEVGKIVSALGGGQPALVQQAIRGRAAVYADDRAAAGDPRLATAIRSGAKAGLALPIVRNGSVTAVL